MISDTFKDVATKAERKRLGRVDDDMDDETDESLNKVTCSYYVVCKNCRKFYGSY